MYAVSSVLDPPFPQTPWKSVVKVFLCSFAEGDEHVENDFSLVYSLISPPAIMRNISVLFALEGHHLLLGLCRKAKLPVFLAVL